MKRARGFTLIELMIVVAIVGILAAVAIPPILSHLGIQNQSQQPNGTVVQSSTNVNSYSCRDGFMVKDSDGTPLVANGSAVKC